MYVLPQFLKQINMLIWGGKKGKIHLFFFSVSKQAIFRPVSFNFTVI